MKTYNKIVAITLGFAMAFGSSYAAPVSDEQPTAPKANLIKFNPIKMASAVIESFKPLSRIVVSIVELATLLDDPAFKKAVEAMQPATVKKTLEQPNADESAKNLSKAINEFLPQMPRVVPPIIKITENLVIIVKKFGEAVINPQATIRGKPALETFENGISTTNKVMKAIGSLSLFTTQIKSKEQDLKKTAEAAAQQLETAVKQEAESKK